MELLKHVAKNHYKEGDPHENISEGDASENIEEIQTKKNSDHVEEGGKEYDWGFVQGVQAWWVTPEQELVHR